MIPIVALPPGVAIVQCGICWTVISANRVDEHDAAAHGESSTSGAPREAAAVRLAQAAWNLMRGDLPGGGPEFTEALDAWEPYR